MNRPIALAAVLVAVAVIGYLAILAIEGPDRRGAVIAADGTAPSIATEIAEENMSNRAASDAATDDAVESAREGEPPVTGNVENARAAAAETGAVGATAFTPGGYDRDFVIAAIVDSDLTEAEKDEFMALLAELEPGDGNLEPALARIRAALELEY